MARGRSKRVTLLDVAKEANCSVSLASIVMRDATGASEETRRRVKAVATRLGYRPDQRARALRSARSGLIGVTFGVHQPFPAEIVDGLYSAAESGGHELVLSAVVGGVDDRRAAETLLRDRCEALIMIAPSLGMGRLRVLADEVPIVAVARPLSCPGVDVVRIDDQGGIVMAVDHLVSLGHRRIVHVDGGTAPSSSERRDGYLKARAVSMSSVTQEALSSPTASARPRRSWPVGPCQPRSRPSTIGSPSESFRDSSWQASTSPSR